MKCIQCSPSIHSSAIFWLNEICLPVIFLRRNPGTIPWIHAFFKWFDWSFYKILRIAWLDINSPGHNSFFENFIGIDLLVFDIGSWRNLRSALFFSLSLCISWYFAWLFPKFWAFRGNFNNFSKICLNFDHSGLIIPQSVCALFF